MSDNKAPEPKPKGKKKLILLAAGVLVVGGGGAAAGVYAAGGSGPKEDPNKPKLVARDGVSDAEVAAAAAQAELGRSPDPAKFKASYVEIPDEFTVNLRDAEGFMQVKLGVSTFYDQRVLDAVKTHEVALKSAVLLTLADQDTLAISTPAGKLRLQKQLARAVNGVLKEKEGFGGVDGIYFTSFIIQ